MNYSLKHYAEVMSGIALGKITTLPNSNQNQGFQLIRPQDLAQNTLLYESELQHLDTIVPSEEIANRLKEKHFLQANDIVITARSTSYHAALIKTLPDNAKIIMNNNLICLRPNPSVQHPEAILVYLNSSWFREQVIAKAFPKMLSINVKWLKELPFTLPNEKDCETIAQAALTHRQLKTDLKALSNQSDTLLEAKMFSLFALKGGA